MQFLDCYAPVIQALKSLKINTLRTRIAIYHWFCLQLPEYDSGCRTANKILKNKKPCQLDSQRGGDWKRINKTFEKQVR